QAPLHPTASNGPDCPRAEGGKGSFRVKADWRRRGWRAFGALLSSAEGVLGARVAYVYEESWRMVTRACFGPQFWPVQVEGGQRPMKISIDIDCTPQEARSFLGLPDVAPMQEALMQEMQSRMLKALDSMEPEALLKNWLPASF